MTYERKQQLKDALASGKALPTELRKQARDLGKDLAFDEAQAGRVDVNFIYARRTLTEPPQKMQNRRRTSTANIREPG